MLSRWQNHIVDEAGNIVPGVEISVMVDGVPASIYDDNAGTPKANPFSATVGGLAAFYVEGGVYDIHVGGILAWQSVMIGSAQGHDAADPEDVANGTAGDDQIVTVSGIRGLRQIGDGVFAGVEGVTIAISPVPDTDYRVHVMPTSQSGSIGTISIGSKTTNSFTVFNSGSDQSSAFEWELTLG
jgi:hypothetical protein